MKTNTIKRNIILFVILFAAVIALFTAFMLPNKAALADELTPGNNAGSASQTSIITLKFDVNGQTQENDGRDNTSALIAQHNELGQRKRFIHTAAVAGGADGDIYNFVGSTIINGNSNFTVKLESDQAEGDYIAVEALSVIESAGDTGYFSVQVHKYGSTERKTIYFSVTITDSFVPWTNNGVTSLVVGNTVNASGAETTPSYANNAHAPILTVNNFSTISVNLSEYLQGRALYNSATHASLKDGSAGLWTVKSVTNFAIDKLTFQGISGLTLKNEIKSSTPSDNTFVRIAPYITGLVEVYSSTISLYNQQPENAGKNFWDEIHTMELSLKLVKGQTTGTTTYNIIIPFKFAPANPQKKDISSNYLRLNVTSKNTFDLASQTLIKPDAEDEASDFSELIIRPSDLMEYSAPSSYYSSYFAHAQTRLNGEENLKPDGLSIERVKRDGDNYVLDETTASGESNATPEVYRITGKRSTTANSTYTIKFLIHYYTGTSGADGHDYETSIVITTYGGYKIKFDPINGKRAVTYNALNSSVFTEMRDRGYLLTDAYSLNEDQLGVNFSNNVLTLDPKVDKIDGQTKARVMLEFTNNSRQVITFESEVIDINVNAGSLFARFDDWEAWLIIAAVAVGIILIILLIVWLVFRAISKHKQDELAMQAPVSSYIVKLNSTIAATQAQQRAAQNQALSQASTQMLLGAGPATGAAPMPDTLQLASGIPSTPSAPNMSTPSSPLMSEPQAAVPPESDENLEELIAKYITDDELLERIFTEKYEPKGMVRRTFFKSKDLQARELDKEKKRIIERYKTPMPMDEAIMSETEIKKAEASSTPSSPNATEEAEPAVVEYFALDFDPESPLYVEEEKAQDEFTEEKIDIDTSPEESRLRAIEHQNDVLNKELAELKSRLDKVQVEVNRAKTMEDELREKIAKAENDDAQYAKDIEDLEFKLASAKNRDKEKITRDIGIKEEKKKRNSEELERLRQELDVLLGNGDRINGIYAKLNDLQQQKNDDFERIVAEREKAKAEYEGYLQRMEIIRKKQELEAKVVSLEPLLQAVNNTDYELRRIEKVEKEQAKERESLKSEVAQAKAQILGTTDFGIIADLNAQISDANSRLSELEREITKTTKQKSDLGIEFNAQRRKANDFIGKNDIPLEEVIKADDKVIGAIEFEIVKAMREKDKEEAEKAVATAQAVYEDLSASSNDVTMIAMEVAATVSELEEEIATVQTQLDDINAQMEAAGEDEKLELMVAQGDTSDKLEELKAKLEQANVDGTKRKMEAQSEYDERLEHARADLDRANDEFEQACRSFDDFINNTNPLDLITSGSGIISKDQTKIEAENLKKQLERSKMEAEQARLAAQQAQEQAEEARRKAQEEAEQARLETERAAQEAIEAAEQARREAEEKAKADIEAAEQARREAEEAMAAEAEEARRRAIEESEEAKRKAMEESEEARRKAMEESEEAKRKAQEEAEEAKRQAEIEAEEAKRKAQEEIEEMRRKAEEEAEAKRLEEENKRKEEEARQKAESERAEAIAKKVALRRDQIIAIRNEMKELKGDEEAKNLRERLYNLQLTFDDDERGSTELMDFYNKTMDDIQNSGEIARLKAENAKKPQRVVRKVTERVNRIPRRKPGAKPGAARPGAARPGARPGAARPGARPGAAKPGARPGAARPGARPGAARPGAARPGARPGGPKRPK